MNYHISRDGQQLGEFTEQQIRTGLADGSFKGNDLAWTEGMPDWQPLSVLFATTSTMPPPIPVQRAAVQMAMPGTLAPSGGGLATASMVLGFFSILGSFLTGIPAIICGHMALSRMSRPGADPRGRGRAITGLIFGYFFTVAVFFIAVLAALAVPTFMKIQDRANMTKAFSNAKQVVTYMKMYAADNNGNYMDSAPSKPSSSNEAFRLLFKSGVADSEVIFGSPNSRIGRPDGNIGTSPEYSNAVEAGENHWAMTKGLTDSDPGAVPLVFENPSEATWPPKWNPSLSGTDKPGRTWSGGKVIVGFNDGSVTVLPLESAKGVSVPLKPHSDDRSPIFPTLPNRKLEVLDAEKVNLHR